MKRKSGAAPNASSARRNAAVSIIPCLTKSSTTTIIRGMIRSGAMTSVASGATYQKRKVKTSETEKIGDTFFRVATQTIAPAVAICSRISAVIMARI